MASCIGPTIVGVILKKIDWNREDEKSKHLEEVAKQAEKAAKLLLDSNKQIATAALESSKIVNAKLEVIRVDVNSNMTAAMQAELDATEGQIALLREVVELKKSAGTKPTQEALSYITAKDQRISELRATLKDRLNHSAAAAAEAAAEPLQT
jgi:hypothetical protein